MSEKYVIKGEAASRRVWIDGEKLYPHPDLSQGGRNYSSDGFDWGYVSRGSGRLALTICLAVGMSSEDALGRYQSFKFEQVANWHGNFEVTLLREEIVGYGEVETNEPIRH